MHSFLPKSLYVGSYAITGLYAVGAVYYDNRCFADKLAAAANTTDAQRTEALKKRTIDNSAWHLLATVSITPLLVIPAIKGGTKRMLINRTWGSLALREKVIPAVVSIAAIPAVVSPVDNATTWAFNRFWRETPEAYHWSGYWSFMQDKHHDRDHAA